LALPSLFFGIRLAIAIFYLTYKPIFSTSERNSLMNFFMTAATGKKGMRRGHPALLHLSDPETRFPNPFISRNLLPLPPVTGH
jgi:hypothetical protein